MHGSVNGALWSSGTCPTLRVVALSMVVVCWFHASTIPRCHYSSTLSCLYLVAQFGGMGSPPVRGRLASPWVLYRRPGRAQGLLLGGRHLVCWARAGCRRAKAKSPGFPKLTPGRALEAVWHSVLAKPGGLWYSQEVPGPRSSVDRAAASGAVCGRSSRPGGIAVSPQGEV